MFISLYVRREHKIYYCLSMLSAECGEFIDVMMVVDASSSTGRFSADYRQGVINLVQRMDIDGATVNSKVQLGICYFGTERREVVPLSLANTQASVISAVQNTPIPGGRTSYNEGIDCANENFATARRPRAKQVVVLIVDGNPDRSAQAPSERAIQETRSQGVIVSVIAVAQGFVNRTAAGDFATSRTLFFETDSFQEFESDTNLFFAAICPGVSNYPPPH